MAPTAFGSGGLFGGGERYPLELARALAREVGCELVTFNPHPRVVREPGGLVVRMLRPWRHWRGHPAHPLAPALPGALAGADLIHTHHLHAAPSQLAALTARVTGARLAVTDHGLAGGALAGLMPHLADRFLLVSRFSAESINAPPDRTGIIYGGADPARYHPDPEEPRDGVLFAGRLTPHKGVDRLLRALPDGAPLTVVGTPGHDPRPPESGYPALLARLAAGRQVRFRHAVGDQELAVLYRRAAVFALPSVHRTCYGRWVAVPELLGLSVLEAMASGTPVVCSRVGGLPEVVRDGETGLLVEPGDLDGLRDRLALLLGDRRLARRLGDNARQLVLDHFTWAHCARACLAAYEEMTSR